MGSTERKQEEFDLFLSHATPDKEWVLTLAERLEARGLRVFVDSREIAVGDNFVLRLSDGLEKSRYMGLVLSSHTLGRPWVEQEWTSFVAGRGQHPRQPRQRLREFGRGSESHFVAPTGQSHWRADRRPADRRDLRSRS